MIKINLMAEGVGVTSQEAPMDHLHDSQSSGNIGKILAIAAVLLLVAGGAFYFLTSTETMATEPEVIAKAKDKNLQKPQKTPPKTGSVAAAAIEETVKEVPTARKTAPIAKGPDYPGEDLFGSRIFLEQMLKNILKVSGEGTGFASLVLQVPNYYYMHGLSPSQKEYNSFKAGLGKLSSSQKVTLAEDRGLTGKSKEFTLYGEFKTKPSPMSSNLKLGYKQSAQKSIESLKLIASKTGINLKNLVELESKSKGTYKRQAVRFQFKSSYKELFPFVNQLQNSKLPIGVLQLSLNSTKDEQMEGVFDLVVYSK